MLATFPSTVLACRCPEPSHHRRCRWFLVEAERGKLYEGMYDVRRASRGSVGPATRVQLLNPGYTDEDPSGRRFALLEID